MQVSLTRSSLAIAVLGGGLGLALLVDGLSSLGGDPFEASEVETQRLGSRSANARPRDEDDATPAAVARPEAKSLRCEGGPALSRSLGSPATWMTPNDYPASALRLEQQGTSAIAFTVGSSGRVSECRITTSSGTVALDNAACGLVAARARYEPARDGQGCPVPSSKTMRITWRIPNE